MVFKNLKDIEQRELIPGYKVRKERLYQNILIHMSKWQL